MIKIHRSASIEFAREDGKTYLVPPATRGQIRRCLELDPAPDERQTPTQSDARRAAQVAILVEQCAGFPVDDLTAQEEIDILTAMVCQHHGIDPGDAVALSHLLKKKAILAALADLSPSASPSSTATPSH